MYHKIYLTSLLDEMMSISLVIFLFFEIFFLTLIQPLQLCLVFSILFIFSIFVCLYLMLVSFRQHSWILFFHPIWKSLLLKWVVQFLFNVTVDMVKFKSITLLSSVFHIYSLLPFSSALPSFGLNECFFNDSFFISFDELTCNSLFYFSDCSKVYNIHLYVVCSSVVCQLFGHV